MNGKRLIIPLLVLCFILSISGLCYSEDPKNTLTVKRIVFTPDKTSAEWITLFCDQSCTPELFSLEGENPRVVMDMKRVFLIQTKARNINTGGNLIKRVRSYLDKQTNILRVVLDMEPSKNYIVSPMQDLFKNTYMLRIEESVQKTGGRRDDKSAPLSQEKRITILHPDLRPTEQQERKPQEALPIPEKRSAIEAAKDVPTVDHGKSELNANEYTAAIDTFTQILAVHPQDFLSYRMRGNAYDHLGDRQKAIENWTQAARLGDTIIQSYLDFLKVNWRENLAP
jgi:tetratricopeptide (TPR) repeat protein